MSERALYIALGLIAGRFFSWSVIKYEKWHDYIYLMFMLNFLFTMMYAAASLAML